MKRLWISVLTIFAAITCVTGCFGESASQSEQPSEQTSQTQSVIQDSGNSLQSETESALGSDSLERQDSEDSESLDGEDSSASHVDSFEEGDLESASNSASEEESSAIESTPPIGTIVPPISNGGNFDGAI